MFIKKAVNCVKFSKISDFKELNVLMMSLNLWYITAIGIEFYRIYYYYKEKKIKKHCSISKRLKWIAENSELFCHISA